MVEGPAQESVQDPPRVAGATLNEFLYKGEPLNLVEVSRLKEYKMSEVELSAGFLERVQLSELKQESCRLHAAADTVQQDLYELEGLIQKLEEKSKTQSLLPEDTKVEDLPS